MEIGIGVFADVRSNLNVSNPSAARIPHLIAEMKLADEVGLDLFGVGEHHRSDYAVSAPNIILAGAATVTKNIKLASSVTVLSSADPVLLYEEFATIDLLSHGRAEMQVGRGSFIESFPLFGYNLDDYELLFEEKLDLLLTLRKGGIINWRGKTRAPLINQEIFPKPYRPEGIPIWVAVGGTPSSVIRAAKLGLPLMVAIIGGSPKQFQPLFELYKRTYIESGHDIAIMQLGVHAHTFIGEDAAQTANDYYEPYANQMNRIGRDRGWPPYSRAQYDYGVGLEGHLLVGDANLVVDKIMQLKEISGMTRFTAHIDVGGPDHLKTMKAIEILGKQVMPQIKII